MNSPLVAVLFARKDSIYRSLPGTDVYDIERNALGWCGGFPVVAHPPCRAWGRLRHFARPRQGETDLALWAVDQVRKFGGVLEHPSRSTLWQAAGLPLPGQRDEFGGFTLPILQWWFGHRADKATWLYFCGVSPGSLPPLPFRLGEAEYVVQSLKDSRPHITKAEREATPLHLAEWLLQAARSTSVQLERGAA